MPPRPAARHLHGHAWGPKARCTGRSAGETQGLHPRGPEARSRRALTGLAQGWRSGRREWRPVKAKMWAYGAVQSRMRTHGERPQRRQGRAKRIQGRNERQRTACCAWAHARIRRSLNAVGTQKKSTQHDRLPPVTPSHPTSTAAHHHTTTPRPFPAHVRPHILLGMHIRVGSKPCRCRWGG